MRSLFGGRRGRVFGPGKELGVVPQRALHGDRTDHGSLDDRGGRDRCRCDAAISIPTQAGRAARRARGRARRSKQDGLQAMMAPEELHGLHMEYEANLERALRGIVTAVRGLLDHPPAAPAAGRRGAVHLLQARPANVTHARLRMAEIVDVLIKWEPGKPGRGHGRPPAWSASARPDHRLQSNILWYAADAVLPVV